VADSAEIDNALSQDADVLGGPASLFGDEQDLTTTARLHQTLKWQTDTAALKDEIDVDGGAVHMSGEVGTTAEKDRVAALAATTEGVAQVLDYIWRWMMSCSPCSSTATSQICRRRFAGSGAFPGAELLFASPELVVQHDGAAAGNRLNALPALPLGFEIGKSLAIDMNRFANDDRLGGVADPVRARGELRQRPAAPLGSHRALSDVPAGEDRMADVPVIANTLADSPKRSWRRAGIAYQVALGLVTETANEREHGA